MENEQKGMKRKIGLLVGVIVIIVALIVTMVVIKVNKQKENFAKANPELAKAMEYDQVQEGEENVDGTDGHVKFDAFFLRDLDGDGYAESIRGTSKQIGDEDTLYMELNVMTAGYLKDAKITVNDGNFYFQTALPKDEQFKDNYIGNNVRKIEFNQLSNGTQKMITGTVLSGDYSYSSRVNDAIGNNINNYSKVNSVTLTGTYVGEDGVETPITKTVNFNIDWYGEAKATIYSTSQNYNDLDSRIDEENGTITLDFSVRTEETKDELILKDNYVIAEIPQLNGYDQISVEYTGSNAESYYDASNRTLEIYREAVVGEDGTITTGISSSNSYGVRVIYPIEAYQAIGEEAVTIKIPVSTNYEGFNNQSSEFENPYVSNTATATITATYKKPTPPLPVETSSGFDITVGRYVSSPSYRYIVSKQKPIKIYNGISDAETDDTYQVRWEVYTGTKGESSGIVMKETRDGAEQGVDNFIKSDGSSESMEEVTTNIGIAISGAENLLKEDGWIKVYDEDTGDLLITFTKDNWNDYTSNNPYRYELPVKHIRVETSATNASQRMYVYNIKELDDEYITSNYAREEFDNLKYIKSTLVGYMGGNYVTTTTHQAHYEAPYSVADIGISKNTISTQATEYNEKLTITARYDSSNNQIGWVNGSFLVKLPQEILTAEINDVQINNGNVYIMSYELVEKDGMKFIKINTQNNNETPQTYSITVDVNLTPDPRVATVSRNIELYASNGEACDYYYNASDIYDVNDNLNTDEKVNYDTTSLSMISPNSLLTNQIGSNYDDKGSQVVSPQVADIKPVYGVIDQEGEEKEATIGVQLKNNYGSTISDIQIVGKIPFEGNTYVISGGDLGSTFTTKMTNAGIIVPEELQQYATVYYSENENPSRDLKDGQNGWKRAEEVTNWDNVKTFLIDLGDYVMPTGAEYVFNYTVKIPNGLEFNQVSYSHHGVYFSLDTDQGKYRTQTEPNRLGFRIAEKYNLELTKYQTGKDKVIPGATYSITDEETGESKTAVTTTNGTLTINNLYAEKAYLIQEIKTPNNYELNNDVIRFIGHVDSTTGVLTIEKTSGTTKEDMTVVKEEGQDYKVTVKVEDEVKANIKIHKTEQGTNNNIALVKYKLTGYGLSDNGKNVTTNVNGEATISEISINQVYTLQEIKAEGYYLAEPITFKIVNNDGNYTIQTMGGEELNQSTTEEDSIPTITINLEDEKIPTYSLQIVKIKKTTDTTLTENETEAQEETTQETPSEPEITYLAGAKFKLYKGTEEIGKFETDSTGTVTINNLYQYIDGKDEEATYTLKEVVAPEGYAKVKDITFKVDGTDGSLKLINTDGTEENYTVEGTTVKLTIEDSPSFRLIKKDKETQQPIANVKFAIYNVDDGSEQPATNSKGEIIGTKETINGREYYTVQTDENGELTADLTEGLYKAVEVQAPEQYDLTNQTYYFGIGASREAPEGMVATQAQSVGGSGDDQINSVAATSDGGYIVGGEFSSTIQVGNETLTSNGSDDGLIIKYSSTGEVEWAKSIGGNKNDNIQSVAETSDGGYIVGGYFYSSSIQVGNETLKSSGYSDGLIIKYSSTGEVEWVKSFVGGSSDDRILSVAETSDGEYIVGGYFYRSIQVGNETLTSNGYSYPDGLIIKYSSSGEVEWAKSFGGSDYDQINSVAETSDGGYIAGGYFSSSSIQVGNETLKSSGYSDGLIIKYSSTGEVEWAKSFGGSSDDYIRSVASTSDGGIIAGGYFNSSTIQVENETLTNNSSSTFYSDGLIIKYSSSGKVEWAKSIGGSNSDVIYSVVETSDGGIIAGGCFSGTIQVGNETLTNNSSSTSYSDGLIIKYSSSGEVEWAKSFGGSSGDYIRSVASTSDGGYIAGGYFQSSSIQVGNETLTSNGDSDGIIIKYEMQELANPVVTNASSFGGSSGDQIQSVANTSDGGYIAGGYFQSSTIQLEGKDGLITLKNNGSTSYYDAMIIKYDKNRQIEWAKSFGESWNDQINSVAITSDGGYIAVGSFESSTIQVGNETLTNNYSGHSDGLIIKYSSSGEVEWAKSIGGRSSDYIKSVAATSDGGYLAGGYFSSSTIRVGNETLTSNGGYDGLIIKYNSSGAVEWAKNIGGSDTDYIYSVASTSDGGYIAGGSFESSSIQVGNETLTNNDGSYSYDGLIIKYSSEGKVEWAKSFGGSKDDQINSVVATSDGGYIAGGSFESSTIQVGNETLTNNGSTLYPDGFIIKYNSSGEVEWAKDIGGSHWDEIRSVASTSDGGYIAGGSFESSSIQVGNETLTNNDGSYSYDGLIIKYSSEGKVEWAKNIGGNKNDYIQSVIETSDGRTIAGGYFQSDTIEVDGHTLENKGSYDGMILEVVNQVGVPEVQELTVENSRKEFKITTDVKEIDGVKGGSISGEGMIPYEAVKYGYNSTKEIVMTPDENYEIIGITVNGEEWSFEENPDGTYTMPTFENMTEDKHVEVTYSLKDNKIIINKVDSEDNNKKLTGATFKLDQIEERTNPENVVGEIVANGAEYAEADLDKGEVSGVLGDLTNNGTYYFVENSDGTLAPTNSKTYQTANEGSVGIQNSTANSYIPINLSDKEGKYVVVLNAKISSESADYGYATVNTSTTAPSYSTSSGRFMYISGTVDSKDYTSTTVLQGGQTYYLHLGYRKDGSIDTNEDQVVINSIKVYEANSTTYNFVDNGSGGYESNNQGQDSTVANSYIPIDLTNYTGKYNLVVNANVSSQSGDYGYATVNTSTTAPSYSSSTGRFVYISGEQDAQDYTTVLQGGQKYYLHLGYYKNSSTSSGEDKFTVNSIKITLNDSELYHTEVTTNNEGQAITQLPFGKYQITEVTAPEGYELNSEPIVVEFRADGNHEFTIENNKKAQVIVHHYLKDNEGNYTTTKVAEDELVEGKNGEKYTTSPKLDLSEYDLEKDVEGNYVIPENATGVFVPGITEVIYYYETKDIPLTVHHYIEGTTTPVPLKDGGVAKDVTDSGKEGEEYTTSSIEDSRLSDEYELVETPENANGTYGGNEVVVTYYYKRVSRQVIINKYSEDGKTPLEGVTFEIESKKDKEEIEQIASIGELTANSTYYFEEQNGKLISNNKGKHNTVANSYIKVDLTDKGDAKLTINAEISSENNYDYGYVTINQNTSNPSYSSSSGRLFRISGKVSAKDYETTLEGGEIYYIHLGYRKDSSGNVNDDTFIINDIKLNGLSILGNGRIYTTNSNGQITTNLEYGEYIATEIETLEGYEIPENPSTDFTVTKEESTVNLNITNKKAIGTVVTHYYIEGTEERVPSNVEGQVVEDVIDTGKIGDIYITEEATNVDNRYELKQVVGEVNGTIDEQYKEIIYYYDLKSRDLTLTKTNVQGAGLEGAVFKIENKENGEVNYATTGENGKVTIQVPVGESVVTEVQAPEGYKLNKEPVNITIEVNKENVITIKDETINYFTLELNKFDAETKELLPGAKFEVSYTDQYGQNFEKTYITDENGKITLENLEDEIVYTLKEIKVPKGYLKNIEEKQFVIHYVDGKYEVEVLKGSLNDLVVEENTIKANIENTPSFKIVKQDNHGQPIQGVKFTITDEQGQEVTDGFGNIVGTIENIDGKMQRVLTTNSNGVIAENLLPGKYVITEVQAPWQYTLPEDESERRQTIEVTQEGYEKTYVEQTSVTDLSNLSINLGNIIDMDAIESNIQNTEFATNGDIVLITGLLQNMTIDGQYTVSGEDINLEVVGGMENAINVIMTPEGKVERVISIKTDNGSASVGTNTLSLMNGKYVALGMYKGTIRIPAEDTANSQELTLTTTETIAQYMTIYNSEGKIENIKDITDLQMDIGNNFHNIQMKDLGDKFTIMYPYDDYELTIPGSETANGQDITLYNQAGVIKVNFDETLKVTNAYAPMYIEDDKYFQFYEELTSDGGVIVAGRNYDTVVFNQDETSSQETIELDNSGDGIIIKYDRNGKVEWAKELGSQRLKNIYNIMEVSDGYIAMVEVGEALVIPAEETEYGEEIRVENLNENGKIMLVKYTKEGKAEWVEPLADNINLLDGITLLKETQNGYILMAGMWNDEYETYIPAIVNYQKVHEDPIPKEQAVVTIKNTISKGSLVVHHYKEGTTESLSEDETSIGEIGTQYETHPANDIPANYELVATPENANGNYAEGETVVTYYYRLKTPNITNQKIQKTGTEKIESLDQEITYNIKYTADLLDYTGNVTVKLVDTLPYPLDTTKTNIEEDLAGGRYDEATKTITWEEQVNDIKATEVKEINVEKTITVVYKDVDKDAIAIDNKVSAHLEYSTNQEPSEEIKANWTTTTGFIINIPVSKVWDDGDNKLGQRPTRVVFKLSGSDGSERTLEISRPGTEGSTTTQDSNNPNKWNDIFKNLPKYDSSNNEIVYTLTEEEKTAGDLKYYETSVDNDNKTVTNTNKYGKVTVHHYVMNPDGSTTTTKVPDTNGTEIPDEIIEGKEGDTYETEPADNVNDKYELVSEATVGETNGTIKKYDENNPQEVIYYYRLKPAKVIIHYLEKDGDSDDSNNLVLANNEQIDGHVDDPYNTDEGHKKDTITKDGKTYTLVSNSGNTQGTMTLQDTNVTYYYLQNTKATVRYVERDPETHEIVKDLVAPRTEEGLVGDNFVTNSKEFPGYKLVESPVQTTIKMTKDEQTLIYYYEPIKTGLLENHIDDKTGKILYTEQHNVQVGQDYNIPPKNFDGYDRVTAKDPINASGTMGEETVVVNYYYIKKAVLEVNYIDKNTGEPLTDQIVDDTKHEGDSYTTEQKTFEDYDLVEVPSNAEGTLEVETDEYGNITNNKTVVTYYYAKKSAGVEEHHIDIQTGEELEPPTMHEGHVGDPYDIKSKDFLSYVVATTDKDGNNVLPTNAQGTMTEEKQVVTYYYYQPAKVIVHYVDRTTGKEIEETNPETGELQNSQVVINGAKDDDYTTTPKDFKYYELVESPEEPNGKMKVEITKDENGKDVVNNTIDVYYYYEPKPFNIGVDKEISAIVVNGNRRNATNGKLEKVDIYRKSTENTSVQVEYKIKVMNTGEISGRAIVEDKLPEGMTLANNDGTWEEEGGVLRKVIPEIGAGETKEYTVLLNWKTSGNNMGNKVNEVALTETDNVPGFKDGNDKDNKDNATVSISVETGEFPVGLLVALVVLVGLESVTLRYAVVLTKRHKDKK